MNLDERLAQRREAARELSAASEEWCAAKAGRKMTDDIEERLTLAEKGYKRADRKVAKARERQG